MNIIWHLFACEYHQVVKITVTRDQITIKTQTLNVVFTDVQYSL
jgi:hypothetical protein